MMADLTTPFEVICAALRPGLAAGILENRARRVVELLTAAGYVVADAETVERDKKTIDELRTTLIVLVLMINQVVDETNLDEEATNLNIVANGEVIAALSLGDMLRQASDAIAKAEGRA